MSELDLIQEEWIRCYHRLLSDEGIFKQMESVFFPYHGITHGDVMYNLMKNLNEPKRHVMVHSLDALLTRGNVASFHFGPEYKNDILTCHRSVGRVFEPHARIFCLDIDVDEMDPVYHLVAIDFMVQRFKKAFGGTQNEFNTMVCTSGNGWHVYLDVKESTRFWNNRARAAAMEWIDFQGGNAGKKGLTQEWFLEGSGSGDGHMRLKDGYRWLPDCTLLHYNYGVFYPDQFMEWFRKHCIKGKVVINDPNPSRFLEKHGFVFSVLYQLSRFITCRTDQYNPQICKLLQSKSIASIFNWLDDFKIFANAFKEKEDCPNPFQEPEQVKCLVFYLCIQQVMLETRFHVDAGMKDIKHPLRAPFSVKFKEVGKENQINGFKYDAYLCIPLGTINNALRCKGQSFKLGLESLEDFNRSGDKKDIPPMLLNGIRAWKRFFMFRSIQNTPGDDDW